MITVTPDNVPDVKFKKARKKTYTYIARMPEPFAVETLEGTMTGKAGDFLAHNEPGPDGRITDYWVIDADIFYRTYGGGWS